MEKSRKLLILPLAGFLVFALVISLISFVSAQNYDIPYLYRYVKGVGAPSDQNSNQNADNYDGYRRDSYKESATYTKTTETSVSDYWGSEKTKKTVSETTEVERNTKVPSYYHYYRTSPANYPDTSGYSSYSSPDISAYNSYRNREPYVTSDYANSNYDNYYYKPQYDPYYGYYNWRW